MTDVWVRSRSSIFSSYDLPSTEHTLNLLNPKFDTQTHDRLQLIENPYQVARANIKTCLLVDVYSLGAVKKRMKRSSTEKCPLCGYVREDRVHFLIQCGALKDIRDCYMEKVMCSIPVEFHDQI